MLEEAIGYTFNERALLSTALTHTSYINESKGKAESYERLEFLGDAILGFTVAEHLFREVKTAEGELTRLRAALVCEQNLKGVAERLRLGEHLRLGRGEEQSDGRRRPSILADAVEAVLAAIYLDGGIDAARAFVARHVLAGDAIERATRSDDSKTELQELVQREAGGQLSYRLAHESGPDHRKVFEMEAVVNGEVAGRGRGSSKKEAEQAAAQDALDRMKP